ncbi:MAG: pyridoxal-phosphate dependent enzyme [Gemmatimonadetes bacterium]|nr:pyridoxal-phosphate dependent enzyme [Gemmatimonadota bacterium]
MLDVRYDYAAAAGQFRLALDSARPQGVFRYRALLPVPGGDSDLIAGNTPLVEAGHLARRFGVDRLLLKDETRNPTRCLKDRATAVAVAMARAAESKELYCASAGNAAISLAGFCAHAGLRCHVFVPSYASPERLAWLKSYGADIHVSGGDYDTAYSEAEEAGQRHGWFSRNCAFNPFLVEGKKTVAFEIAEALDWNAPDTVVAPVGDGCTLAAIGKGFRELRRLGLLDRVPRLVGAQAEAMQPLVRRWQGVTGEDSGLTDAASINVRRPRNALRLLEELRQADGELVAVTDQAIESAQTRLAREAGIVVEFTAAAGLAALDRITDVQGHHGGTVVVVLTGGRVDREVG